VINDDNDGWLKPAFAKVYCVLARDRFAVSFYGWRHADKFIAAWRTAAFRVVGHLMFSKRCTSTTRLVRYQHECAYLLAKGDPKQPECAIGDVIAWTYSGNRPHPTQKPLPVLIPLVKTFSAPGALVLDPFAGSSSSLVAAKKLGRDWLGIELDAEHQATADARLACEADPPA
jgi:adenine-specific DNA-methyltransferase